MNEQAHADGSPSQRPLSPRPRQKPIDPDTLERNSRNINRQSISSDSDYPFPTHHAQPPHETLRGARSRPLVSASKRLSVSSRLPHLPLNGLPSAPASPPTPAPSPTPFQRAPSWASAGENEDSFLRDTREHFSALNDAERQRFLAELLNMCNSAQLSFVSQFVSPRLKKDPFEHLPDELCFRVSCVVVKTVVYVLTARRY